MPEKDLATGGPQRVPMTSISRSGKALNSKNRNISQISEKTVTDKMMIFLFWTDGRNFRFYNCPFLYKCIFWCFYEARQAVQAYKRGRAPSFSRPSPTVQARRARSPPKATGFFLCDRLSARGPLSTPHRQRAKLVSPRGQETSKSGPR